MALTTNVPSDRFEDLQRDVQDATRFSNATAQYQNRVGETITPIPMRDQQYAAKIAALGFARLEGFTFETGATVPDGRSLLLWSTADGGTGFYYYFSGEIPSGGKIVPPDSTPASTGGTGAGGWLVIDDLEARLASAGSQELVGGVKASALSDGATTTLRAMGWTFPLDIKPFIEAAAAEGFKKLMLGKGDYTCSELSLTSAFQTMEIIGAGSGFAYTPQTTIRPAAPSQTDIFISQTGVGGVDNVKFKGLNFNGNDTCGYAVRQLSGAGWVYEDLQATGFTEWVLWAEQGLNHYGRMFIRGGTNGGSIAMYSDFFADNLEVTGGATGIRVMAGGGRLSNILSNSQTECCIELSPLNSSTNHINTALSNIYVGEVFNSAEKPIIRIKGLTSRRVTDVQMSNVHTVSASASGIKHNWHVECEKADRVTINGLAALGIGQSETNDLYDAGGIKVTDSTNFIIASGTIHNISRGPLVIINSEVKVASGVNITDWGSSVYANSVQKTAIYCNDNTSKISIASGVDFINNRVASATIGFGATGSNWAIGQIGLKLSGTPTESCFAFTTNSAPWSAFGYPFGSGGVGQIEMFGRRLTYTGTFESNGAGDYTFKTLLNSAVDQCYNVSIQQNGSGANATSGMIFANGTLTGAVTSGNTNTVAALQNSFKVSGLNVQATIGSGYGATTWRYQMTRML